MSIIRSWDEILVRKFIDNVYVLNYTRGMAEKKETKSPKKRVPARRTTKSTPAKAEVHQPVKEAHVEAHAKKSLPGIGSLFETAWALFKKTFFSYFRIVLLGIGFFLVGVIVTVLLTLPLMFLTGGAAEKLFSSPSALEIVLMVVLVAWMIAFILGIIAYSIFAPIVYLFILDSEKNVPIKELFRKAKPLFWPYTFVGLLTGVAVLGGLGAFIVPGILFSLYFVFVLYVMVFEGLRGTDALRRSYALVKNNFWEIVIRIIILQAILIGISYILNILSDQSDVINFLSIVISFGTEWFGAVYMYTLYNHIRERKAVDTTISLSWIWVVAGIGLVMLVILVSQLIVHNALIEKSLMMQGPDQLTKPGSIDSF